MYFVQEDAFEISSAHSSSRWGISNRVVAYSPGFNGIPSPPGASSALPAKGEIQNWLSQFWEQRMCLNYRKGLSGRGIHSDSHTGTTKEGASSGPSPSGREADSLSTSHYHLSHENELMNLTIPSFQLGTSPKSKLAKEKIRTKYTFYFATQ